MQNKEQLLTIILGPYALGISFRVAQPTTHLLRTHTTIIKWTVNEMTSWVIEVLFFGVLLMAQQ